MSSEFSAITAVDGPRAKSNVYFQCVQGPQPGEKFVLDGGNVLVGRSSECRVCVDDTSVSRKHLSLSRHSGGWCAVDLGSCNGTWLNGAALVEETPLQNADRLTLGRTEWTFVQGDNATPLKEVRPPRATRALWIGAAVLISLAGVVVGCAVKRWRQVQADRLSAQAAARGAVEARALWEQAKGLVRKNRWVQAQPLLEELQGKQPTDFTLQAYLKAAGTEIPTERAMERAEALLSKGEWLQAQKIISAVPEGTRQFERVRAARARLARAFGQKLIQATRDARQGRWEQVQKAAAEILAVFPDHLPAREIQERARLASWRREPRSPLPLATQHFLRGELALAERKAQRCGPRLAACGTFLSQLRAFAPLFRRRNSLGAEEMEQLLSLDLQLAHGRHSKPVLAILPRAAVLFRQAAQTAHAAGQWARAGTYASQALKVDSHPAWAAAMLQQLREKAKELYLRAYGLKETDAGEAIRLFKEVVAMTSSTDQSHFKAEHWLSRLNP